VAKEKTYLETVKEIKVVMQSRVRALLHEQWPKYRALLNIHSPAEIEAEIEYMKLHGIEPQPGFDYKTDAYNRLTDKKTSADS
jgi:hypothetical protein